MIDIVLNHGYTESKETSRNKFLELTGESAVTTKAADWLWGSWKRRDGRGIENSPGAETPEEISDAQRLNISSPQGH